MIFLITYRFRKKLKRKKKHSHKNSLNSKLQWKKGYLKYLAKINQYILLNENVKLIYLHLGNI